jgi:MFS superfamily sulfate permease-like transporter
MTWTVIAVLAGGVALQRLAGMFVGGAVLARVPTLATLASLIPAAVVGAVVVQLSITTGRSLVVDERLIGMAVAGVLVWRKAPMVVTIVAAAATTAVVRAVFGR